MIIAEAIPGGSAKHDHHGVARGDKILIFSGLGLGHHLLRLICWTAPMSPPTNDPDSISAPSQPETASRDFCVHKLWAGLLVFIVTLLVYYPAVRGGFIWDDDAHVTRPDLRSLHGLWRIWFDIHATQQYYPLLHSAFWVEHRLWGDAVAGYHLVNVLLHVASALLVVAIVRRLSLPGDWLAGFLF